MGVRDPHRFINELDKSAVDRIIDRLEKRAKDKVFTRLFEKYIALLAFPSSAQILEIGCGTGANLRLLAQRGGFSGKVCGIDQSQTFVEAASRFAYEENVADRIELRVGDIHSLSYPDDVFDIVIAHTVISHVTDPSTVIREMGRVVKPGGTVVIFDGDYASLTYAHTNHEFGRQMDAALASASFNNPRIMRELPKLLPTLGLQLTTAWGDVITEIGHASYFKSFAETYAPYVAQAGLMSADDVDSWMAVQQQSIADNSFFAACNYYTYLSQNA